MVGSIHNSGVVSVDPGAYLVTAPASGEAVIHNITHSAEASLEFFDGVNSVEVAASSEAGSWMGMFLHSTATRYYRIKNNSVTAAKICFDGIVTGV